MAPRSGFQHPTYNISNSLLCQFIVTDGISSLRRKADHGCLCVSGELYFTPSHLLHVAQLRGHFLDIGRPTCINFNRVLWQIISSKTASLDFLEALNVDVTDIAG